MQATPVTAAQRAGIVVAVVEAILFGIMAALHFESAWRFGQLTHGPALLSPIAIVDVCLALVLAIAVFLPGGSAARAGRVLGAQILCLSGMFGAQIALLHGASSATGRDELCYGVVLLFALASMLLIATPTYGTRRPAH